MYDYKYSQEDVEFSCKLLDLWAKLEAAERGMRRIRRRTMGAAMPSPGFEHL